MKTICGVLGGLIMSWSAYVKICSWGHHKRKAGGVIRFLWECSFGAGRVVRIDSVVGIVVQYLGLGNWVLRLRVTK